MWLTLCVIATADLRLAAACGSRLDQEVMEILSGGDDTRKQGRRLSLRKRYLTFAWETGAIPVFPTKHTAFFRYALYLSQTGVESGFDGVGKYITEVVRWNQEWGYPDFRETQYYWWDRFRDNFKKLVPVAHKHMKLPIRPAHLEAMAADADLDLPADLQDITTYYLLYFCGVRIGHVAGSSVSGGESLHQVLGSLLGAVIRGATESLPVLSEHQDSPACGGHAVLVGDQPAGEVAVVPVNAAQHVERTYIHRTTGRFHLQVCEGRPSSTVDLHIDTSEASDGGGSAPRHAHQHVQVCGHVLSERKAS